MSGKVHCWWKKVVWRHQCTHADGRWYRKKYWHPRVSWMWMCNICPRTSFHLLTICRLWWRNELNRVIFNYGRRECWSLSLQPLRCRQTTTTVVFFGYEMLNSYICIKWILSCDTKTNANLLCLGWKGLVWLKSPWCMHVLLQFWQTFKLKSWNVNGRSSEIVAPQDQQLSYSTAATMIDCHNPIQSSVTCAGSCLLFLFISRLLRFHSLSEIPQYQILTYILQEEQFCSTTL